MKTTIATTSTALRINHKAQTIELTKAFAKDAERFGSKSYKELNEARHEFPTYDIAILRQKAKDSHKGLNLDYMKKYIDNHDETGKVKIINKEQADSYLARLDGAKYTVTSVKKAQERRIPHLRSSLQHFSRKLHAEWAFRLSVQ